jgi:tRNA threonylcarbamoyladenosine biosynthesis protein TsaB
MNLLAIDTSSSWCSVAILIGQTKTSFRHQESGNAASQLLLPWIQELMHENEFSWLDLDGIAVSEGPGAFTGVRLGVGVAQGLAMANSKPLIPVASLDGIAAYRFSQNDPVWHKDGQALVAIDARMDEVYWAVYQTSAKAPPVRLGEIQLSSPDEIQPQEAHIFAGNGFSIYQDRIMSNVLAKKAKGSSEVWVIQEDAQVHALGIAYAAQKLFGTNNYPPEDCQPLYVRDKVAQTTAERNKLKKNLQAS